nr:ATP synthase F0 subunit 8 [Phaeocystis rex]
MPQFDLFTFSSQIFWSLSFFTLLYLSFSYYLVPSISAILKVRNRKLTQQSSNAPVTLSFKSDVIPLEIAAKILPVNDSVIFPFDFGWINNDLKNYLMRYNLIGYRKNYCLLCFFEACSFTVGV